MSTTATPGAVTSVAVDGADRATDRSPTPPPREGRGLRLGLWVAIVLIGLLLAALTAAIGGGAPAAETPLDPRSPRASGAQALVRVLEQQGTEVDVVHDVDRVDTTTGTVFVDDSAGVLAPAVARRIARTAPHVVLVTTNDAVLDAFGTQATPAAQVAAGDTVSTASCDIPAAAAARTVSTSGTAYTVRDRDAVRCAPTGSGADRAWGLVQVPTAAGEVTLVGTTDALRNDTITTAGNAALALGLLGGQDRLTWYVPTAGSADAAPSLGELAPPWIPSAIVMLAAVAVAAAVWRGRRLGPLVVEQLPVVVRAAETTEGRARLYARTRDRTHALDTLRIAAIRRLARTLGLGRSAHVDAVVQRAATVTGRPAPALGQVLVGGTTADDRALVDGAAALDELERAVTRAVAGDAPRASRPVPDQPTDGPQPGPSPHPRTGPTPDQPTDRRPGGRP